MSNLFEYALRMAQEQKASGEIQDFDVNPASSVITVLTDQGWMVWLSAEDQADDEYYFTAHAHDAGGF